MENLEEKDALRLRNIRLVTCLDKMLKFSKMMLNIKGINSIHQVPEFIEAEELLEDQSLEQDMRIFIRHLIRVKMQAYKLAHGDGIIRVSDFQRLLDELESYEIPTSLSQFIKIMEREAEFGE